MQGTAQKEAVLGEAHSPSIAALGVQKEKTEHLPDRTENSHLGTTDALSNRRTSNTHGAKASATSAHAI